MDRSYRLWICITENRTLDLERVGTDVMCVTGIQGVSGVEIRTGDRLAQLIFFLSIFALSEVVTG
jgi:hypothetical protein